MFGLFFMGMLSSSGRTKNYNVSLFLANLFAILLASTNRSEFIMPEAGGETAASPQILPKEWDEISCPICMDHPHNAILLLCSSHGSGCRPFICDTSYRHSNCLDRFKKPHLLPSPAAVPAVERESRGDSDPDSGGLLQDQILKCPLCRGSVLGYRMVKEIRQYLDQKPRACSYEACSFLGSYVELRRHARRVHPSKRPAAVDPARRQEWAHLEREQEIGDVVSALRSTTPDVVVIGDYVVDGNGGGSGSGGGSGGRSWRTTLLLLELLGGGQFRSSSRSWRNRRSGHRNLWGENLLGLQDDDGDDDNDDEDEDDGESEEFPVRQRSGRRRSRWGDVEGFLDGEEGMSPLRRQRRRRLAGPQSDGASDER